MQSLTARPIFIVGSPRSGTSILTWCLGQHPNILPLDETTGLGKLTIALGICYQTKMALGAESLWSALSVQKGEFFSAFGRTINELILDHQVDLERRRWEMAAGPAASRHLFVMKQPSKARWVDGTPHYSFHICGLRQLFPGAQFIHVVRDVTSVVRSMLNFHRLAGVKLVDNEQEAYGRWYRAVTACLLAEKAYGPQVVFRLRHSELVENSEASLGALLEFLGEPYAGECLIPLRQRINSSNVPADFKLDHRGTDSDVIERAIQLNAEIETTPQPGETSASAADTLEREFNERVQHLAALDKTCAEAHARAERLVKKLANKRAVIQALKARR